VAAVAAVVLAGCGEAVDTAKQTFPRSTVPAGQVDTGSSTGKPKPNDPTFSNEQLRKLDPCALLSKDILASLGTPAENRMQDFGSCSNYMEDKDGKDLNITIYVGESLNGATDADEEIGGLPAFESELDDGTACFVSAVTATNPNLGLRVQVGGEKEQDLCATGHTVLTGIVTMIRDEPPERDERSGSIASVDPCGLLDPDELKDVVKVETEVKPYSLHWCNWVGDSVNVGAWFRTGYDPKDSSGKGSPVDLGGGVTAYQTATVGAASCRLEWRHRSTGADGADEIIEVDFDNSKAPAGDNGCPTAVAIAKLLIPALPKP
jgi:hypothetical protein